MTYLHFFYCPVCGVPKTHHRLLGFRCDNPDHNERESQWVVEAYQPSRDRKREIICENCGNLHLPQGTYCEYCGHAARADETVSTEDRSQ